MLLAGLVWLFTDAVTLNDWNSPGVKPGIVTFVLVPLLTGGWPG